MKKRCLILAAAAALMVSCSTDGPVNGIEPVDPLEKQNPIGFSTWQNSLTRAGSNETLETYHTTFSVYGTKQSTVDASVQYVFGGDATTAGGTKTGTTVTYSAGATAPNEWTYSPYRYWDKQANYTFIAFAPASAPLALSYENAGNITGNVLNNFVSTADYTLTGQNLQGDAATEEEIKAGFTGATGEDFDMMVSTVVSAGGSTYNPVNLTFQHILAKFNVTVAKAKVLDDAVVTVKSLTIDGLKDTGYFSNNAYNPTADPKVSAWDNDHLGCKSSSYQLAYNGTATELNEYDDAKPYYFIESLVMPQTIAADQCLCTLKYSITTGTGSDTYTEDYTYTFDLETVTSFGRFFDRSHYQLNITIDPTVILFDADVAAWADDEEADHTIE